MTVELLDFSYDRLTPAQVRAAGRVGVIRYVASARPAVSATLAEVVAFRTAGLVFCAVWQNGKSRALNGWPAGAADGADAASYTARIGASAADPVYFSVDFDAQPADMAAVGRYFAGVASILGWERVGVYAGLPALEYLRGCTPVRLYWQTTSYSDGVVASYANLLQYAHDQTLAGAQVDFDRALTTDYGQWDRMALKSSPRGADPVIWIVIHTAEGPYDDDPANPTIDPGSVDRLRNFFADPAEMASSHAGCDDDQLSDGWVPYDRAAWTLRDGNPISDNLEMCARAGWTRAQWLTHPGMIRNAAKWAAGRCQARNIRPRRLTAAQVAARNITGILDHNTYTVATGDGTHWDVGPGFPWDVFLADVQTFMQGGTGDDTMSAADVAGLKTFLTSPEFKSVVRGEVIVALADPTHSYLQDELAPLKASLTQAAQQVAAVAAQVAAQGVVAASTAAKIAAQGEMLTALAASGGGTGEPGGGVDIGALTAIAEDAAQRAVAEAGHALDSVSFTVHVDPAKA